MNLVFAFWCAMGMLTILLTALTYSYLTHDPETCRTCVDRTARHRRRHPPEDRPEWGHL